MNHNFNVVKYRKNQNVVQLQCYHNHPMYGKLTTIFDVIGDTQTVSFVRSQPTDGIPTPEEKDIIIQFVKQQDDLSEQAKTFGLEYLEKLMQSDPLSLTLSSVFVVSSQTHYTRIVKRFGYQASKVEEFNEEHHRIHIAVSFEEIPQEIRFIVTYDPTNGYKVDLKKNEKWNMRPYWSPENQERILPQIIARTKEVAPFFLP